MTINVKATKPDDNQDRQGAARYRFAELEESSKKPAAIALLITGLALYLKSAFPGGWGQTLALAHPDAPPEEPKSAPKLVRLPGDNILGLQVDPEPVGTSVQEPIKPLGWAGGVTELFAPFSFTYIPSPEVEMPDLSAINLFTPTRYEASWVGSANDNNGPGVISGGNSDDDESGEDVDDDGDIGEDPDNDDDNTAGGLDDDDDDDGDIGEDPENDDDDPAGDPGDDDDDKESQNRAPSVTGPVYLNDVFGCMAAIIGLTELLKNASDPDGDALTISNLTISSGTLTQVVDGWTFHAALLGPVTIMYQITDGEFWVTQYAYFDVQKNRPIIGTDGNDVLVGTECADDIDGGACDDNIDGRGGNDTLNGGDGNDNIVAGAGNDIVFGGSGNDIIFGLTGNDSLSGGKGNDRLFGGDGDDILFGDQGDDLLHGDDGQDMVFGGAGRDVAYGGGGDDIIHGGDGDDVVAGDSGNDVVFGEAGDDALSGGDDDDLLSGGQGKDIVLAGAGNDTVIGDSDSAEDSYDGGAGVDTLDYSATLCAIEVDLWANTAEGSEIGNDSVANFEIVKTGAGDDTVMGTAMAEEIHVNAGDDEIEAGGGDDIIADGDGCDTVEAGSGSDTIVASADGDNDHYNGGDGADTLDYSASHSAVLIDLQEMTATGYDIGADEIASFEAIVGGAGDDHFKVTDQPVSLKGGGGSDVFQFEALTGQTAGTQVVHDILDFMVGDRIKISKYEIFKEVMNSLEDRFEDVYGAAVNAEELPIRIRHEQTDQIRQTLIDVDFDRDDSYEMTINISGDHVLLVVDNA